METSRLKAPKNDIVGENFQIGCPYKIVSLIKIPKLLALTKWYCLGKSLDEVPQKDTSLMEIPILKAPTRLKAPARLLAPLNNIINIKSK